MPVRIRTLVAPGRARSAALLVLLALVASLLQPASASGQAGPAFLSDDFNRPELGDEWEVVDPLGDGTVESHGAGTGDARVELSVPAGVNHEPWVVNRSLRIMRDAEDTDFTAVARFQSVPTQRYQMQGIVVQQDDDDWMRFDVNHDGTSWRAFAGSTTGRESTKHIDEETVLGAVAYVQVARRGDTWTLSTSADGVQWTEAGSFDFAIEVSEIGVFAGNAGANPGYTAVVDYLFEAGIPIEPEDGGNPNGVHTLDVVPTGPGALGRTPDKASYAEGEEVTLTAVPNPGADFAGWSGDVGGGDNPLVVTMDGSKTITGSFAPDTSPPVIEGLTVAPRAHSAVITWTTDETSTATVRLGPTEAHEYGPYGTSTPATEHTVVVPGLSPATSYHFTASSTNVAGIEASAPPATFRTAVSSSVSFESDDFNRDSLIPKPWSVVDPLGDGTVAMNGAGSTDARLELGVPGGVAHNGTNALRVMQPAADINFAAEIKLEALPTQGFQSSGLLLEQGPGNWVRFGVYHDGADLRAHGASMSNGQLTDHLDQVVRTGDEIWLRVTREEDTWMLRTSDDGVSWTEIGTFDHALAVNAVGPFAANAGAPAPAYTSAVDYFFEGSAPLSPEDEPEDAVMRTLETDVEGNGTIERVPDRDEYVAGTEVRLTAVPDENAAFTGWAGDVDSDEDFVDVFVEDDMSVEASFADDATVPTITDVTAVGQGTTAEVRWTTDEPTTSSVAVGPTTAYENGRFESPYRRRNHAVTVTGLNPGATYNFAASSSDAAGHTTTAPNDTFSTTPAAAPAINVWYGHDQVVGTHGRPQTWANVTGNVSDPDGVTSMTYSLNGGPTVPITLGPNSRRLQNAGDFNADVPFDDLVVGENEVQLTARDATGQVATATVTLERVAGDPSLPYDTDWSEAGRLQDQAQPVDGRWTIDGDTVRPAELGYDRVLAVGDTSWRDYEVTVPVTVESIGPGAGSHLSGPALVGMGLNWQGHTVVDGEQPGYNWYPTGALAWYRWYSPVPKFELRGNEDQPIDRFNSSQLTFGETYMFKARAETVAGGVEYSWKIWPADGPEPAAWALSILEEDGPPTGSVILIAHHADVRFGNVSARPIEQ